MEQSADANASLETPAEGPTKESRSKEEVLKVEMKALKIVSPARHLTSIEETVADD
jgi:hypothetical protein